MNGYLWSGRDSRGHDNTNGYSLTKRRLWMLWHHRGFLR